MQCCSVFLPETRSKVQNVRVNHQHFFGAPVVCGDTRHYEVAVCARALIGGD